MFQNLASFGNAPAMTGARARNMMLDWFFYDVDGLTSEERAQLVAGPNSEGAVIVVWPRRSRGAVSLRRFDGPDALRAAPGPMLTRFTIAGVGSSDIGAAAFARSAADVLRAPVGAIVAGYGVADLLSEAMGGWFVMGGANRVMQMYREAMDNGMAPAADNADLTHRRDCETLGALLRDAERRVDWLGGHSKGCTSIARALQAVVRAGDAATVSRQQGLRITTVSAVTAMPAPFANIGQYLGELDWFGGMNSQQSLPHVSIPGGWHHLNTEMPGHVDFAEILRQEPVEPVAPAA